MSLNPHPYYAHLENPNDQEDRNPSHKDEQGYLKNRNILNMHILLKIRELEWSKRNYILNANNQIRMEYKRLANLIGHANIKLQKCRALLESSNAFNNSDPSYIQFLLMQSENEIANSLSKYLDTADCFGDWLVKSNINFSSYKELEKQEINQLKYDTSCLIEFETKLNKFHEINKLNFSQEIYDSLIKRINEMEEKWIWIENSKKKIVQRYKLSSKFQILINFSQNFVYYYQNFFKKYDQIVENYKNAIEEIDQNYPKHYCSDIIYLGNMKGIISFDTNWRSKKYYNLEQGFLLAIPLPNNELFCCGYFTYFDLNLRGCRGCHGGGMRTIKSSYILDCSTFKYKKKIGYWSDMEKYRGSYLNGLIYLFRNTEAISFDIETEKQKKLIPLPASLENCSCIPFKKNILIGGKNDSSLYIYDIDINSYSKLDLNLNSTVFKLLCFCSRRAYVIEFNGFIYESEFENEFCWSPICKGNIEESFNEIYWINNDGCIWFGILNGNAENTITRSVHYYSFNIKKRELGEFESYGVSKDNRFRPKAIKLHYKNIENNKRLARIKK